MTIVWNEQSIRWFHNASEYTGYNTKLAQILLEHIPRRTTLCDIGCGAGLIDFELAPFFREITCVDIARPVIDSISAQIERRGIANITPLCADAGRLDAKWDTVIALFHGEAAFFPQYLTYARDRLVLACYANREESFGPLNRKAPRYFDASVVRAQLDAYGVNYTIRNYSLEYGQPLRDYREAETFVRAYCLPMCSEELHRYLDGHLQRTGRTDFPYYLPKKKNFSLFVIHRDENEKF